jgi:UDP-N-acetylglucosamine--N-acetylmuramyl-(pentapeptide) pyrophosphoryl-undecaprenol N-acetylglucosamine transferase
LVLGGSQGAAFINELVARALGELLQRFFVVHQTGRLGACGSSSGYYSAPYFHDGFPDILAAADLVISRAGANTLSEIAMCGKPSILIPLPSSGSRGDQIRNAEFYRRRGAALVLAQSDADAASLVGAIDGIVADTDSLTAMGRAALSLARPDAASSIARAIHDEVGGTRSC